MLKTNEAAGEPVVPVEMTIGEMLDNGIYLFKDHFWLFTKILLVILLPSSWLYAAFAPQTPSPFMTPEHQAEIFTQQSPFTMFMTFAFSLVQGFVLVPWLGGAVIYAAAALYFRKPVTAREAIGFSGRRLWRLGVANFGYIAVISIGYLLCLVPGIIALAIFCVLGPIIVLENSGIFAAFERSFYLTRKNILSLLALLLVVGVMTGGVGATAALAMFSRAYLFASVTLTGYASALGTAVLTMVYFSLRCQKEDLDLELLAQAVEAPRTEPELAL